MGFFSKLFNRNPTDPRSFVDREARLTLSPLHNASFHLSKPRTLPDIPIVDLSSGGLGLMASAVGKLPKDSEIEGMLRIEDAEIFLSGKVVHNHSRSIGIQFHEPSLELKRTIQKYFDVELRAIEMTEQTLQSSPPLPGESARWFLGTNNCELFIVERDGVIQLFRISYFGNSVEFEKGHPLRFAQIYPNSSKDLKSGLLRLVSNIAGVSEIQREQIRKELETL